jgi:hypothetical protein
MDWDAAIERHREALKRVVAALVAMAGLGSRGQFTFFPQDGALPQGLALAEKSKLSPALTLPRHLYRAVLALLRPAEAAARRLVIVAARGLVVPPPALPRLRKPEAKPTIPLNRLGLAMLVPPRHPPQANLSRAAPRALALPLFDTLHPPRLPRPVARGVPRISVAGYTVPFPIAAPPSRDDPIDATRLVLRFEALASALDNLPAQARRFARWQARCDAVSAQIKESYNAAGAQNGSRAATGLQRTGNRRRRSRRIWPLRPGRPPGWRKKPTHEVHDILDVTHGLAIWAMERPDTS